MCLGLQHLALASPPCLCDMLRSVAQNAEDGGGQGPRAARYGCGPQLFMLSHTGTSLARRSHCVFAAVTTQTAHRFGLSLACHAIDAWTECCLVGCCDSYLLRHMVVCRSEWEAKPRGQRGIDLRRTSRDHMHAPARSWATCEDTVFGSAVTVTVSWRTRYAQPLLCFAPLSCISSWHDFHSFF